MEEYGGAGEKNGCPAEKFSLLPPDTAEERDAVGMNIFKVDGQFRLKSLLLSLLLTLGTGALGALFAVDAVRIYDRLILPAFAPPAWLFAPVWTLLFLLMGLALYRVRSSGKEHEAVRGATQTFVIQLIFNLLWSILFFFFGFHAAALADILILLFYLVLATVQFFRIDRAAGWLMLPADLWVLFAVLLNLAVVTLNG